MRFALTALGYFVATCIATAIAVVIIVVSALIVGGSRVE